MYKLEHPLEKRKKDSQLIRSKYPDRIPIIVEVAEGLGNQDLGPLDREKYLVPADLTVAQFLYIIRKKIKLNPEEALFIFVNGMMVPTASDFSSLYDKHKDDDGFLYLNYSTENTFG